MGQTDDVAMHLKTLYNCNSIFLLTKVISNFLRMTQSSLRSNYITVKGVISYQYLNYLI